MILLDTDAQIELLKNNERGEKILEIINEYKDQATTVISLACSYYLGVYILLSSSALSSPLSVK